MERYKQNLMGYIYPYMPRNFSFLSLQKDYSKDGFTVQILDNTSGKSYFFDVRGRNYMDDGDVIIGHLKKRQEWYNRRLY